MPLSLFLPGSPFGPPTQATFEPMVIRVLDTILRSNRGFSCALRVLVPACLPETWALSFQSSVLLAGSGG